MTFEKPPDVMQLTEPSAGDHRVAPVFRRRKAFLHAALCMCCIAAIGPWLASCAGRRAVGPIGEHDRLASGPAATAISFQPELTEEQLRQIQLSREVLFSGSTEITTEARRNAASLLIDLGAPESREVIVAALASENAMTVQATLTAMLERPADPLLLDATLAALRTAPNEAQDALASALAAHHDIGLERVSALALDSSAAPSDRVRAIHALAAFRTKEGLTRLMSLLDESRQEPAEIIAATCASLDTLTGMRLGEKPAAWRVWWSEFRDKPFAEVLRITVRRLTDQLAAADQRHARLSELYADALRDIYLLLPKSEQLERLSGDLSSELPTVRQIALDRVDRLLRDQERLPDSVKLQLAACLNDPQPSLRKLAARLLDETNFEQISEALTSALERETDASAAQEYLRILSKRPTATAATSALRWMNDSTAGVTAAGLIARLALDKALSEEALEQARIIARSKVTAPGALDPPPAVSPGAYARLLAILGKERDLVQLDTLLMSGPTDLRQAIADGYALTRRSAPLLQASADPLIFPFALRASVNGQPDVSTLQRVIGLAPPEQHRELWLAEVRATAGKVPPASSLAADDLLAGVQGIELRTRLQMLQRAIDLPADQIPAATRRETVLRSAELLLALDDPFRAMTQLDALGAQPTDEQVRSLRLHAAAIAGEFDLCKEISGEPSEWIALLRTLVTAKNEMAYALRREIEERFAQTLDESERTSFNEASQLLRNTMGPEHDVIEPQVSVRVSPSNQNGGI